MKVFIVWSGRTSEAIATALRDWLPQVIQQVDAFVSGQDIEMGELWRTTLASELEATDFGVLCLTPDNTEAPWLLFEAGALAKHAGKARVCPLLFGGLKWEDVAPPLSHFAGKSFCVSAVRHLVESVNNRLGDRKLDPARLAGAFSKFWPDLDREVEKALRDYPAGTEVDRRSTDDMVRELLDLARSSTALQQNWSQIRDAYVHGPGIGESSPVRLMSPFTSFYSRSPVEQALIDKVHMLMTAARNGDGNALDKIEDILMPQADRTTTTATTAEPTATTEGPDEEVD